ncbi:MAG TPA: extracellular solute-binding protein [Candidatus Faecalibacterium gallistercoris]|uniref:Extracellular solute-binding protein n=1 Tax=Candidatus Faecalibacterium gallistercoris TaxID=2838579 RepID=A0A9D2FGW0_9FIRM|nr:extracellular solute-binding protein [Candidatus Faecalibacterium gallistercoris]
MRKKGSAPRLVSRRDFLRLAAATAGAAAVGGTMSGCSEGASENVRLMVWSPSLDQAKDSGEWLQTCCNRFAELHPEWDITYVYGVVDETAAGTTISQDTEASADVFMFTNDVLTNLIDAGAIAKFGGIYADEIKATNSQALLDSLTVNDYIYGVPFTTNTWFMYYDKSVFTEEDIKSLDAMLAKDVVSFPFTNSWYLPAFYFGNGCTLFGDGTQEELGADFGGDNAVEVTNYLIDLYNNPNFVVDADGSGLAGMRDGSIKAMFTGSWDAAALKETLGDNMGVAALPTFTLNGEEKQMYAYAGSKAIGVNVHSKYMVQAIQLAIYLGGAEAQQLHYDLRTVIPCNTELLADPAIASDELVAAQNETFDRTSILQPFVASMSNCWTPVENLGKGIRSGTVTHDNAAEQTKAMNDAMNSDGIS